MNKLVTTALISLLLAGPAAAAPVLKSQIMVTTPIVTVGDMFEGADLFAERPLFRAPEPGTAGKVSLDAVRVAAAKVGLTDFESPETGTITVARFGQTIDTPLLSGMIEDALRQRGFLRDGVTARIGFTQSLPPMTADTADHPVNLVSLNYLSGSGQFAARFRVSGQKTLVDLTGRADLMIAVPHLVGSVAGKTILRPEDVEMREVPVRTADTGSFSLLDQVIGMQIKRPARAGKMLQPGDIEQPALIKRNQAVTIVYRSGPLTLTVKGQALSDAAEGETVEVLNLMSSKVLSAIASAPGRVTLVGPDTPITTAIR